MKHALKVSRHLKSPAEALSSTPIWISDALLAETFDNFSRGCRRHGSHVPGPLEARRRATRRKNTNIAYNGTPPTPIDVAGLFSPGKQGRWWKQPHIGEVQKRSAEAQSVEALWLGSEVASPSRNILSWFGHPPAPPIPQAAIENLELKIAEGSFLSTSQLKAREVAFQEQLSSAQSLDEVRSLVRKQELSSSQALVFPTLALQHILQSNWSLRDIEDFLLDSTLNPSGAKPFRVLGNALKGKWLDQGMRAGLFELTCQCVTLGVASPEEVKYIIMSIPRLKMPLGATLVRLAEHRTIHGYYQRVLSAIQESKVLSIPDLGGEFMFRWFKDISNRHFAPAAAHLLWEMRHYSSQSEKNLASSLLFRLLPYGLQEDTIVMQDAELGKFLTVLPTAILPHVFVRVTQSVVALPVQTTDDGIIPPIVRLHNLFAGLGDRKVQHILASGKAWRECLSEPGPVNERASRAIIVCWVAVSISKRMRQAEGHLRDLNLRNVLKELYSDSTGNCTRDVLARFLETLQSMALPNTNLLLRRLRFVTDDYLVAHNKDFMLRVTENNLIRRFSLLQNDRDYDNFRTNFNDALVELAESINEDLKLFLHVSRHYIEKDESAVRVIFRILKHNLALHKTLSQSWPTRIAHFRATVEAPRQLAAEQVQPTTLSLGQMQGPRISPHLDPRQVLDLMNHLAISFATSPVIEPRQAVRRVYWCFEMLHRYGAPIESPITRAFWHAAVTRQGKNGTSTTLLKWILQQVRLVEGENVANMLMRSSGFREKIEGQFANLKWPGKEMPRDDVSQDKIILGQLQKYESVEHEPIMHKPVEPVSRRAKRLDRPKEYIDPEFRGVWRPLRQDTMMGKPR
jgi:hypothetical protein